MWQSSLGIDSGISFLEVFWLMVVLMNWVSLLLPASCLWPRVALVNQHHSCPRGEASPSPSLPYCPLLNSPHHQFLQEGPRSLGAKWATSMVGDEDINEDLQKEFFQI